MATVSTNHPAPMATTGFSPMPALSLWRREVVRFYRNMSRVVGVVEMDGTNLKQLTQGKEDIDPAISPDGQWVVFTRTQGGKDVLMKVPSGGGPTARLM